MTELRTPVTNPTASSGRVTSKIVTFVEEDEPTEEVS